MNDVLKKSIGIINGANLNLLGTREISVYGSVSFEEYLASLKKRYPEINIEYFQSNIEGEIIDALHEMSRHCCGIVVNPGGYSHTSVSIADAIRAVRVPVVEVHISMVFAREEFRRTLVTAPACKGFLCGFGLDSYALAVEYLCRYFR